MTPSMYWDYFPTLFVDEQQAYEKLKEVESLEKVKADRRRFAEQLNERFHKGSDKE